MLEHALENVTNYIIQAKQAKSDYEAKIKEINLIYKNESMIHKLEDEARKVYETNLAEAFKLVENLPSEIANARKQIEGLKTIPIPDSTSRLIEDYATLPVNAITDMDKDLLMQNAKSNMLARRIVSKKYNIRDNVMEDYKDAISTIELFENAVKKYIINTYKEHKAPNTDAYEVRVFLHRETTDKYVEKLNQFYNQFTA